MAGALTLTIPGPSDAQDPLPSVLEARLAPLLVAGPAKPDSIERLIRVLATKIQADTIIVSVPAPEVEHSFSRPASGIGDVEALRKLVSGDWQPGPTSTTSRYAGYGAHAPAAPPLSYLSVPLRRRSASGWGARGVRRALAASLQCARHGVRSKQRRKSGPAAQLSRPRVQVRAIRADVESTGRPAQRSPHPAGQSEGTFQPGGFGAPSGRSRL